MTTINFHYWLSRHFGSADFILSQLAGDASLRRYYRVKKSGKTWIAMDASAEIDRCAQFIAIADALRAKGLRTPEVFARDLLSGYLLLSDFGDELFLQQLNAKNADALYTRALDSLATLSTLKSVDGYTLPHFTAAFMREELGWFQDWFLEKYLGLTLSTQKKNELASSFDLLAGTCAEQPQVFMHRDYHSANLMVLPDKRVGILDFQDAFIGPVTYDLASLLRDCYVSWPDEQVKKWVLQYHKKIGISASQAEFMRWFDWMGMQRHLKALMTFSRKFKRDQNSNYLQHIPRTLNYVLKVMAQYPELSMLYQFLQENVSEQVTCVP